MRDATPPDLDQRLAQRLAQLRLGAGRSLDELAAQTGLSRATLSRFERGESSPSAAQLSRLAIAYGLTASRVLAEVETVPVRHLALARQQQWSDAASGFTRRMVGASPTTSRCRPGRSTICACCRVSWRCRSTRRRSGWRPAIR